MAFGPADHNLSEPRQKSYHEDAAVKRALAAERMQANRGLRGTPLSGRVSSMTTPTTTRKFDKPSSDKQRAFIRSLIAERDGESPDVLAIRNRLNAVGVEKGFIPMSVASKAIEDLIACPKASHASPRQETIEAIKSSTARTNKFAGHCSNCKVTVEAGEGLLERQDNLWVVYHKEGECPAGEVEGVPAGHYAVSIDGVVKFFFLDTSGMLYAQASDDLHPIKVAAHRAEILDLVKVDTEAASKLYGREIGRCGICNRTLTDEVSRANGIGPVCASKQGW
jgi:hypothetical protein